jgi:ABC-type molybdate transport system permease subunit
LNRKLQISGVLHEKLSHIKRTQRQITKVISRDSISVMWKIILPITQTPIQLQIEQIDLKS